jgi:hypothetical protein
MTPVANNRNNIRLQIPESEIEGKNLYICFLYYPLSKAQVLDWQSSPKPASNVLLALPTD